MIVHAVIRQYVNDMRELSTSGPAFPSHSFSHSFVLSNSRVAVEVPKCQSAKFIKVT